MNYFIYLFLVVPSIIIIVKQANHIQPCRSLWKFPSCLFLPLLTEKRRLVLIKLASRSFCRAAANACVSVRPCPASSCLSDALGLPVLGAAQTSHGSSRKNSGLKAQLFWLPREVHLHLGRSSNKTRLGGSCHELGKTIVDCVFSPSSSLRLKNVIALYYMMCVCFFFFFVGSVVI